MNIMLFAIPVFFILIAVELLIERKHNANWYRLNDAMSNISCGISQQVTGVFVKSIGLFAYVFLYENLRLFSIPNTWWSYLILFIAIDFLYYFFHRYCHEINIFWGTHVVHHQSEDYNLSVALRQSAFQSLISSVFYLPLAIVGFDPIPFLLLNALQTLYQFWIHTEAIRKMPQWFEFVFNTPSHHRVHHGRNPEYIDKNHGGTLILFDRMFNTFQEEKAPVVYGVTKPLSTWNPIWANFDYYQSLWQEFILIKGVGNKFRLLIEKPGWRPEAIGGPLYPPEVDRKEQLKYQTKLSRTLSIYSFVHYIFLLGATTLLLANASKTNLVLNLSYWGALFLILWTVAALGIAADQRKIAFYIELCRLIAIPMYVYLILAAGTSIPYASTGLLLCLLISTLSAFYLFRIKKDLCL